MALRHRVICCARGYEAQTAGEFIYLPHAEAFVFTTDDAPRRELSWRARYYLEPGQPDLTGEPVRFTTCPYCGADLPIQRDMPRIAPPTNSEGSE